MELKPEQIDKFKKIHQKDGGLESYSEDQIKEIANGMANLYLALFDIYRKIKKDEQSNAKK